jgi:serine O-acetyltransferase
MLEFEVLQVACVIQRICVTLFLDYLLARLDQFSVVHNSLDKHSLKSILPLAFNSYYQCVKANNFLSHTPLNCLDVRSYPLFLALLARHASLASCPFRLADRIYYLNRSLHGINVYHNVSLPQEFFFCYSLNFIMPNTIYGNRFVVYHGVSIGSATSQLPTFGSNVILMPNCIISGKSQIGSNVVVSAGVRIIDQDIPDNVVVFQSSDNRGLVFKHNSRKLINKYFSPDL